MNSNSIELTGNSEKKPEKISILSNFSKLFKKSPNDSLEKRRSSFSKYVKKASNPFFTTKQSLKAKKGKNYLWIVFFVKKFVNILRSNNIYQKMKKLNEYHYNLIDDKAYCIDEGDHQKKIEEKFILNNPFFHFGGEYVSDRLKITKHYLKTNFFLDFLTTIPFFLRFLNNNIIIFLTFIRILKVRTLIMKIEEYLELKTYWQGVYNLLKLILFIFYIAHCFCCIWHFIAYYEILNSNGTAKTWLHDAGIVNEKWTVKYVNSLYFAIVTMITVGYGDISAIWSIIIMLCSCGVFGYSLNSIGNIISEMYRNENEFKEKIKLISMFMKQRNINKTTQSRVKRYMEYIYDEETKEGTQQQRDELLNTLPKKLKEELLLDLHKKIINDIPFLNEIAMKIKEVTYAPDDIIFRSESKEDRGIYYVIKGSIDLFLMDKNKSISTLKKGQYFGEFAFMTDSKTILCARSIHLTTVGLISYYDFLNAIKKYPLDFEKYCMLKDLLTIYGEKKLFGKPCPSCNKTDHWVLQCNLVRYIPDQKKVIDKYFHKNIQQRKSFYRNPKKKKNWKKNIFILKIEAKKFSHIFDDPSKKKRNSKRLKTMNFLEKKKTLSEEDMISHQNSADNLIDNNVILKRKLIKKTKDQLLMDKLSKIIMKKKKKSKGIDINTQSENSEDVSFSSSNSSDSLQDAEEKKNKEKNFDFFISFDAMKSYKIYFPHNNIENILRKKTFIIEKEESYNFFGNKLEEKLNLNNLKRMATNKRNNQLMSQQTLKKRNTIKAKTILSSNLVNKMNLLSLDVNKSPRKKDKQHSSSILDSKNNDSNPLENTILPLEIGKIYNNLNLEKKNSNIMISSNKSEPTKIIINEKFNLPHIVEEEDLVE